MSSAKLKLLSLTLLVLVGGVSLAIHRLHYRPLQLDGVKRLVLQTWDNDNTLTNSVVVDDAAGIAEILSTLRLREVDPCPCGIHRLELKFEMEGETARASICDHCFDLVRSNRLVHYSMPPRFLELVNQRIQPVKP
jgi:hypothetical protein